MVSGYYGFNNNGDDALLLALCEDIKREKDNARVLVLSHRPKETKKIYRTDAVNRVNIFALVKALKGAKVLLSGGGSLLQDETSSKSLWFYFFVIKLAKLCNVKIMQFANVFGPVKRAFNCKLTARVINDCVDVITLRDTDSEKAMRDIGVTVPTCVTADPAMLLEGASEKELCKLFEKENIPNDSYIAVSVRDWKNNAPDFELSLSRAIRDFADRVDTNVIFVPMQYPHDVAISKRIAKKIGKRAFVPEGQVSIREAIGIIGNADLNIAMRLHSMIYSLSEGVKTIALRYDPKIDGFMNYVGLSDKVDVETITKETLGDALVKAFNKEIPDNSGELRKKAKINTLKAIDLISK